MEHKSLNFVIVAAAAVTAILIGLTCADPHHSRHHEQKQAATGQTQRLTETEQLSASSGSNGGGAGASDPPPSRYSEPFRAERINRGLSSIFNGVRSGSLEEILRGSFTFTRNENVRGVADNVLSGIFGSPVRNEGNLDAYGKLLNAGGASSSSSANARG